jgi:hypothetical protein
VSYVEESAFKQQIMQTQDGPTMSKTLLNARNAGGSERPVQLSPVINKNLLS